MARLMNIGEAAEAAGVSAKMVRHYERIGLVPAAVRTESGYRQYSERDLSILRFIRQSRQLGFSMEQIADLLGLWSDDRRASREVKALAQEHLGAIELKMREMADMQQALKRLVASCHGDEHPHCAILDELAVRSTEAPLPGAVGGQPLRRSTAKAVRPARPRAAAAAPLELMAWTRNIHANPGRH